MRKPLAIDQPFLPKSRHEYKSTWNVLSQTIQQAIIHVIGDVGDSDIRATAEKARECLETSVGIRKDDVIIEIGCGIGRVGHVLALLCKQWIGCDVSGNILKHAKSRLEYFNIFSVFEKVKADE